MSKIKLTTLTDKIGDEEILSKLSTAKSTISPFIVRNNLKAVSSCPFAKNERKINKQYKMRFFNYV